MYFHISQQEVVEFREDLYNNYSEHLEMLGDNAPGAMVNILCGLLLKEKRCNDYLKCQKEK